MSELFTGAQCFAIMRLSDVMYCMHQPVMHPDVVLHRPGMELTLCLRSLLVHSYTIY